MALESARAELESIERRLAERFPRMYANYGVRLISLHEHMVANVRPALLLLFGAVTCVLLIACANVANLLLARATARRKEMVIRTALGARRGQVMGLVVRQGLVLAGSGVGIGIAAAFAQSRLIDRLLYGVRPTDPATFFGTALFLGVLAVVAIYIPAARATRTDPVMALRGSDPDANRRAQERAGGALTASPEHLVAARPRSPRDLVALAKDPRHPPREELLAAARR